MDHASFIYSTAPVPAQAAAARQAIELICSDEGGILQARLWKNVEKLKCLHGQYL